MTRTLALPAPVRLALVATLALALAAAALVTAPGNHDHEAAAASKLSRSTFHDAMRVLWEDHVVWTRMAVISIVEDRPDQAFAIERLLRNQDDIGDAVKPFYGEAGGEVLSALLREHIGGAAELLVAAKTGVGFDAARQNWYANGDEIGAFLADANPVNWDRAGMQAMMRDHLNLTLDEAVARLSGDFAADVAAYDTIHVQILHMADMLSDGLIAQFPHKFAK